MAPLPAASIKGIAFWTMKKGPFRFTARVFSQAFSSMAAISPKKGLAAALLMRISSLAWLSVSS